VLAKKEPIRQAKNIMVQSPEMTMTPETVHPAVEPDHDDMSLPSTPSEVSDASTDEAVSAQANTGVFETCVSFNLHNVL
jgi:hypothetical protein